MESTPLLSPRAFNENEIDQETSAALDLWDNTIVKRLAGNTTSRGRKLLPPPTWRTSVTKVREWYNLSLDNQKSECATWHSLTGLEKKESRNNVCGTRNGRNINVWNPSRQQGQQRRQRQQGSDGNATDGAHRRRRSNRIAGEESSVQPQDQSSNTEQNEESSSPLHGKDLGNISLSHQLHVKNTYEGKEAIFRDRNNRRMMFTSSARKGQPRESSGNTD